jgi:pimeloyl-ACP methyl ester carboxylesterase
LLGADLWRDQIAGLNDKFDRRVTDAQTQHDSLEGIAEAILATAPPVFALAGMSMGGVVAQEIVRQAPDRVTHLTLIDTTARPDTDKQRAHRAALIRQSAHGRFTGISRHAFTQWVHPERAHDFALYERIAAMTRQVGREAFVRQQTAMLNRRDYRPALAAIRCPLAVICGREDRVTPPDLAEEITTATAAASLTILERCGHLAPVEQPEAVTAIIGRLVGGE